MDAPTIIKLNYTNLPFNDSDVMETNFNFSFPNSSLSASEIHDPAPYFGEYLDIYNKEYGAVHKYLSCILCAFGITANFLNIIVLTRKNMVSSINAILTGLAVADMAMMLSYLPYAYLNFIGDINDEERFSYPWAIFLLLQGHFMIMNHTVSIWLTVTVAIWRFIAINFPLKSVTLCSLTRAKFTIAATYVTCIVFCIPIYMSSTVSKIKGMDDEIFYKVCSSQISKSHDRLLRKFNFWLYSVFTKFVPCVALTVLSLGLIRAVKEANKLRQKMRNRSENDTSHDKTTKIILAVVLLFLLTQFPIGLLVFLSAILGTEFYDNVYINFGETIDALGLINSASNIIVYCAMNKKFRDTFSSLFIPKCKKNQKIVPIEKPNETVSTICE